MYDDDAVWTLTAPDGTAVTLAGPSFFASAGTVFLLEEVTGFDSPNVRQNLSDLPEADGSAAGDFFFSSRPVTFKGKIVGSTASARNAAFVALQRALRGMRANITIRSQAAGLPAMQTTARLDNVRKSGGYIKDFMVSLICPDPLLYSQATSSQSGTGQVATSGVAWPIVWPAVWGGGTGATVTVSPTTVGNYQTFPVVRVTGPITNPWIRNTTNGGTFYIDNVTLAAGEYVDIDMRNRTVLKNDGTDLYYRVRFPGSAWIGLDPGANVLELRASAASAATLTVSWPDSWV